MVHVAPSIHRNRPYLIIILISFAEPMAPDIMAAYGSEESLQDRRHFNVTIGKDISILRGSPLTLKCPVVGVPEPKITWIKDRKMLSSNDRMNTDCIGTLDIHKVELEDSGDYVCSAQSYLGMDIAFSAVTVFGKNVSVKSFLAAILTTNSLKFKMTLEAQ